MSIVKDIIKLMNNFGKRSEPFLFILDFDLENPVLVPLLNINPEEIRFEINGFSNINDIILTGKPIGFKKFPVTIHEYRQAFEKVMKEINAGNTYLLNLTFATKIETGLQLAEVYDHSKAPYKLIYKDQFVVFSPEAFIKIEGNIISSYPMKGTIDAGITDAESVLLRDEKELAEHYTIVDLIRNDLSMVSKNVNVKNFRYVDKITTHEKELLQTSSQICGELNPHWKNHIGDILIPMLPAGSISGAPKKKTVEIIKRIEKYDRGYFTGIFGYFNGEKVDSAVMIRFIENIHGELIFKSGGGITSFSQCESEYREMIDKVYIPIYK